MHLGQSAALIAILLLAVSGSAQGPDVDVSGLADGPYSRMQATMTRTFLKISVATVEVRVDEPTRRQLERIARGHEYSEALEPPIIEAVLGAERAFASLRFERNVSLDRWVDGVATSLDRAQEAGLVDPSTARDVAEGLPQWFGMVAERGFRDGDRILYELGPASLRTLLLTVEGEALLDRTDEGEAPRRALLAGYFAPGGDFREPLVRSLFE